MPKQPKTVESAWAQVGEWNPSAALAILFGRIGHLKGHLHLVKGVGSWSAHFVPECNRAKQGDTTVLHDRTFEY
ncbi:hypothetical protein LCGC14_2756530, partial [marine sediment metagenome]